MVTTRLPKTQFGEDRCTKFRVIVVTDPHTHPQTPLARPLQTVAYLGFQKSVPLPSRPSLPSPPFPSYLQCTVTVCIMYINYISSMAADVSIVPGLLLDTFQLQVNCLNVNQFLLCSLTQTVGLCNAREIVLLFSCNSRVICFFLQSLCIFL